MAIDGKGITTIGRLGDGTDSTVGDRSLGEYIADDETLSSMIVGTDDGLVHKQGDWERTERPGADGRVVVAITDRRSIFVVGDCRDPDVEGDYVRRIEHGTVDAVETKDSLLSTWFKLTTNEGVEFVVTPETTEGIDDVANYIRRASMQWQPAMEFLETFEEKLPRIETALAEGNVERADQTRQSLYSGINKLGQTSSLNALDLPALDADREMASRRLTDATCRGHWHRSRTLVEDGDEHRENGDLAAAVDAYRDAAAALREMVSYGGPRAGAFDEDELEAPLGPHDLAAAIGTRLRDCGSAVDADVLDEVSIRSTIVEGFEAVAAAVDDGAPFDADEDVATMLSGARRRAVEACDRAANHCEDEGDAAYDAGADDGGREWYVRARDLLADRRDLTNDDEDLETPEGFEERVERIETKIERSRWEWGGG